MPYYEKYLKPSEIEGKEFLCLPFCDGVHFEGYILDIKKREIVHIDSFRWNNEANPIAIRLAEIFFQGQEVTFRSYFSSKRQFDSITCGVWLVAGFSSFFIGLPENFVKKNAFEICYSLLDCIPIAVSDEQTESEGEEENEEAEDTEDGDDDNDDIQQVCQESSRLHPSTLSVSGLSSSNESLVKRFSKAEFLIETLKNPKQSGYLFQRKTIKRY